MPHCCSTIKAISNLKEEVVFLIKSEEKIITSKVKYRLAIKQNAISGCESKECSSLFQASQRAVQQWSLVNNSTTKKTVELKLRWN